MIKGCKICGVSDSTTLKYIINHPYPPQFIGFICNYKKRNAVPRGIQQVYSLGRSLRDGGIEI